MKKIFLLLVSYLLIYNSVIAQGVIQWQNTIGGNHNDRLNSIQQTADGGFIIGGFSSSNISGDKTRDCKGGSDYWIVKTDSLGNIQWQNTIGGSDVDQLKRIYQTKDGGYILGGNSNSNNSGDKSENNIDTTGSTYDYWIVKTDSIGNIQWQNTIGGSAEDNLYSIQQTIDGGYILGGHSYSNISGDKTENNLDSFNYTPDIWIIKTDSMGNILWQNTIGGTHSEMYNSIQQTKDEGYIIGSSSMSSISGDKLENNVGLYDYWIVKTDSIGSIQWQNTIGGNHYDYLVSMQQTSDSGYILGGVSLSTIFGDKSENSNDSDFWVVKTDHIGNIQWQNTIGGNDRDELKSIIQTANGGYLFGGWSNSNISGDKTENSNDSDYWVVKTDPIGNIQWQNTIGGSNHDWINSIVETADGGFILSGSSSSNFSGDKTENCIGFEDYWIVKLTENFNSLNGKLFIDGNSNGIQDTGEVAVTSKRITETNGNFSFSDQNGHYSVSVLEMGSFSVSPASLNYYQAVPVTHNAHFSGMLLTDSLNDFAYQPTGVFNDVCVRLTPLGAFRNGFNAAYRINYENVGTTTLSGSVVFFLDSTISFVSSSPAPTAVYTDSIIWNYTSLAPFQSGSITVTVNVHAGLPIGTLIHPFVRIDPVVGDVNPSCNFHSWEVFSTTSFDPNDILVDEDTLWSTQFPNPPYLEYIIRFQNTGNDTAFNVKILNPLDTSWLDLSSLEFVASSHPVNMSLLPWERNMEFKFNNILLPDSNTNETLSHGFVRYIIKPKNNLTAGDSIANYAAIYFDFNAPVITNTVVTKIVLPLGINPAPVAVGQLIIYPNPTEGLLTISGYTINSTEKTKLQVYDILGNEIFSAFLSADNYILTASDYSPGVYFIKIGNSCARFIKQ